MQGRKPLRTESEYQAALSEASVYFDHEPEVGSAAGERFEALLMNIEAYEAKPHKIQEKIQLEIEPLKCRNSRPNHLHIEPVSFRN